MPPKKNVYCGTKDKPPKGKTKGTLKECQEKGQIRLYGLRKTTPCECPSKKKPMQKLKIEMKEAKKPVKGKEVKKLTQTERKKLIDIKNAYKKYHPFEGKEAEALKDNPSLRKKLLDFLTKDYKEGPDPFRNFYDGIYDEDFDRINDIDTLRIISKMCREGEIWQLKQLIKLLPDPKSKGLKVKPINNFIDNISRNS